SCPWTGLSTTVDVAWNVPHHSGGASKGSTASDHLAGWGSVPTPEAIAIRADERNGIGQWKLKRIDVGVFAAAVVRCDVTSGWTECTSTTPPMPARYLIGASTLGDVSPSQ